MMFLGLEVGSWADWFSAVGTVGAVILALYTRRQRGIINAKAYCRIRKVPRSVDDPSGKPGKSVHVTPFTQFKIILSNLGNVNLLVTGLEVEIEDGVTHNLLIWKPEVIEAGDVRNLLYNGFDDMSPIINESSLLDPLFPKSIYEYIKLNEVKLIITTHDGNKTTWPIEIVESPSA